jgi:hypothetical protein
MISTMFWPTADFWSCEGAFMTDPNEIRRPLTELLQSIEAQDKDEAANKARLLATELDQTFAPPDPLGREYRPAPVKFSGLRHALLREVRTAERHIGDGNWPLAAKALRSALQTLPEPQRARESRTATN